MRIGDRAYRSIWLDPEVGLPTIIDQTLLPHRFELRTLDDLESAAEAISSMRVRGAPLIGATAAYGIAKAVEKDPSDTGLARAGEALLATRPTAVNLAWAVDRMIGVLKPLSPTERAEHAYAEAAAICDEDVAACESIGSHGFEVLERLARSREGAGPLQVLTHCNAGWLATVDWGTALAPIYKAAEAGLDVHVWVDETRPRNQGASLTAFELREMGIPHTVVVDNAGGHLMQRGLVDLVLVGSDRTTARGDVCNKIGTYLKALAAHDNDVPFYVALPTPTIDWTVRDGVAEVPIEQRAQEEVTHIAGVDEAGVRRTVRLTPAASPARNDAFDVTPARLVTGLITEFGVVQASADGLAAIRRQAA